jgi:hypothetical protein
MFASLWASSMLRSAALGLGALVCAMQATAAPICKPHLAFRQVNFSPINYETMERRWSATLAVDASRCATTSGRFEILFVLMSETAPDDDLTRTFTWAPGLIDVAVDLTANEWFDGYWLQGIAACPCRD